MTAAFTFPGQGSQAVGMGKALADAFPAAKAVFDEVDAALGEKLTAIIWEGPAETLQLTENAQPALMAVSLGDAAACWKPKPVSISRAMRRSSPVTRSVNIPRWPRLAVSLSATRRSCCARAASPCEGRAGGRRRNGGAARLDYDAAVAVAEEAAQGQVCQAANDNGGGQVVVSGDKAAVERALEIAKTKGAKRAMLLPVSAPFHCRLMRPRRMRWRWRLLA